MKKIAMIFSVCLLAGLAAFSQEITPGQVPATVRQAFAKQFPAAKAVKYGLDNADYKIVFQELGKECIATLNAQGKLLEIEKEVAAAALPKEVSASIAKNFAGYSVMTAVRR